MEYILRFGGNLSNEVDFIVEESKLDFESLKTGDVLIMEFSLVRFVTPFCMLGLLSRCKRIADKTKRKVLFAELRDEVFLHFQRMNLFEIGKELIKVKGDYTHLSPWSVNPRSLNLIEILKVNKEKEQGSNDVNEVIRILRERASDILQWWLHKDKASTDYFVTMLSEIAQNIFEHSRDHGFVALQRYVFKNERKVRLNLSVLDGGIGIVNDVKRKLKKDNKILSFPSDYIWYPFVHGLARSGGGGLLKAFESINRLNASLFVRSGTSYVINKAGKTTFEGWDNVPEFQGTHMGMWLEGDV